MARINFTPLTREPCASEPQVEGRKVEGRRSEADDNRRAAGLATFDLRPSTQGFVQLGRVG